MNKERAAQRIATLRAHLQGPDATDAALQPFETAAFSTEYSVTLPEKLTASEPWLVRRYDEILLSFADSRRIDRPRFFQERHEPRQTP